MPVEREVQASFAERSQWTHSRWDSRLLARVTGRHSGTTDENIQWAACKWGISDNVLRAVAVRASNWYQYEVYPNGTCVLTFGCADLLRTPDRASRLYCAEISRAGHDYERDFGAGRCPKTFSVVGVMSWQDPSWDRSPRLQNGTFPFNRDSTAFALDYFSSYLRACDEGWVHWLKKTGDGTYGRGDLWGCVGSWYAGAWHTKPARAYVADVRHDLRHQTWLDPAWGEFRPPCTSRSGCPHGL
ncbi:hypothetical protein KRR39_07295 [Nocardioides panacis]|uniref:Uncharacterized protein n=1 Tax=Nocardioides panacis TaxID=2849501 RepID=A0A975T285_9ACTN|nr:hypothetical protein [Nocardioides panacis]QWZ09549.1 hypothetical protein KRR39_07295 [Nocardioides panacis]